MAGRAVSFFLCLHILLQTAGCDALTVHLAVTTIGTSIAVGYTPWCILGVMTIMGPWMLAHWEEYHSGIMLYGNGYWGVTEANYLMIALHFFTAAVGPGAAQLLNVPSKVGLVRGNVCVSEEADSIRKILRQAIFRSG